MGWKVGKRDTYGSILLWDSDKFMGFFEWRSCILWIRHVLSEEQLEPSSRGLFDSFSKH